ncbi:MAG: hypothetical protein KatS3mg057_1666 [Herpetosiphonaceae bacterium]|nr:MAG: hypothetical protein KatS3mg057_1666 [Herpetosiphonaceae bacterium]
MQLARQEISLKQAEAGYTLFGVIALDLSQPAQGCSIGGFDVAQVPALDRRVCVIGIAAFPPQISYDGASAVIIGK